MIRRTLPASVLLLFALSACDTEGTITLVPEYEESFDFESGLAGWIAESGGLPAGTFTEVERVSGSAAEGLGWVRMAAVSEEAGGRVWIARPFQVTADQSYEVTVTFSLGTSDDGETVPWDVVAGAGTAAPTAGGLQVRGSTEPEAADGGFTWDDRTETFVLISGPADPGGETATVWLALGIGVGTAGDRAYGLDEIGVSFLRN